MLAIHPDNRRAYWRVERQRLLQPRPWNRKSPGRFRVTARCSSIACRVCSVISNLTGRPVVLPNGRSVDGVAVWCDVVDPEAYYIAATQLAIDREIEERQIPRATRKLQPRPDRPDVLRLERWFRSDQLALVPGSASQRGGVGFVDGFHGPSPVSSEKAEHAPPSKRWPDACRVLRRSGQNALDSGMGWWRLLTPIQTVAARQGGDGRLRSPAAAAHRTRHRRPRWRQPGADAGPRRLPGDSIWMPTPNFKLSGVSTNETKSA